MRIVTRIVVLVIGLYILAALGLVEIMMGLLIGIGKVIIQIASLSPMAAAIGVLLVIVIAGSRSISDSNYKSNRNRKR